MRIRALTLERYGSHEGRTLALEPGLMLVAGPNEAGKSTLLDAVSDLLWGMPRPARHAYPSGAAGSPARLALAGVVEVGGRSFAVRRTTRGLFGAEKPEEPLDPPWGASGPQARRTWRESFGLGHAALRAGGDRLCAGEGDLAGLVFTARSGRDVRALLERLDEEADRLYKDHRNSRSVEVRRAVTAYEQAREAVGARMARAGDVADLAAEIARLERRAAAVARDREAAARTLDEAGQRVRAYDPAREVARARAALAELAAQGVVLDPASLHEFDAAQAEQERADTALEGLRARLRELQAERSAIAVDDALAADGDQVRELDAQRQARRAESARLGQVRAEAAERARAAEEALAALAPAADDRTLGRRLAELVVPADRAAELDALAGEVDVAQVALGRAEEAQQAARRAVREVAEEGPRLDPAAVQRVAEARRAVLAVGSAAALRRAALAEAAEAGRRLAAALSDAGVLPGTATPGSGTRAGLPPFADSGVQPGRATASGAACLAPHALAGAGAQAPPPLAPAAGALAAARGVLRETADRQAQARRDEARAERRLASACEALDALVAEGAPADPETLARARAERDAALEALVDALHAAAGEATEQRDAPVQPGEGRGPGTRDVDPRCLVPAPEEAEHSGAAHRPGEHSGAEHRPGGHPGSEYRRAGRDLGAGPGPTPREPVGPGPQRAGGSVAIARAALAAERAVRRADALADGMIAAADRTAELARARADVETAQRELATAERAVAAAEQEHAEAGGAWAALWAGCPAPPPDEADAVRRALIDAARAHADGLAARARAEDLLADEAAQAQTLAGALAAAGRPRPGTDLDTLLVAAQELEAAADEARDRRSVLARLRADAERAARTADAFRQDLAEVRLRWRYALAAHGLPPGTTPDGWRIRRDGLAEAVRAEADARRLTAEARRLANGVSAHEKAVRRLLERHARGEEPDAAAGRSLDEGLAALARRVRAAEQAAVAARHVDAEIERCDTEIRSLARAAAAARARLDRLGVELSLTAAPEEGGLAAAAGRGREALRIAEQEAAALGLLRAAAPDLDAEVLVGESETVEESTLADRLEQARAAARALEHEHAALLETLGGLRDRRQRLEGAGSVAELHAEAQGHLARAAEAAERYVVVHLQREILRRELENHERRHSSPLLADAGRLLARLTAGRFTGLRPAGEAGRTLVVVRADGEELRPAQLSEGTADQAFLALRLAGIRQLQAERRAQRLPTVPVVLDDVLMTFDDGRAAAALEVLAELAEEWQILLFTHHVHLVGLAPAVPVVELGSPPALADCSA